MKTLFVILFLFAAGTTPSAAVDRQSTPKDQAPKSETVPPTLGNVPYGKHERNVLDFWKAEGETPRPLLVFIHGGGWTNGDKTRIGQKFLQRFLRRGVSVASINYRMSDQAPLPAPVHDAARAVQFLRWKAPEWNLDPQRIALSGGSAGGCTSMWILLHDDLADPNASDPVQRESTRVSGAAVSSAQPSIDPRVVSSWVGPNVLQHRMIHRAVGERTMEGVLRNEEKYRPLFEEFSPYNHLDGKDPPLFLTYGKDVTLPAKNGGHGIHHPVFGIKTKEKSDALGHECHLLIPGVSKPKEYKNANQFLLAVLLSDGSEHESQRNGGATKTRTGKQSPQGR